MWLTFRQMRVSQRRATSGPGGGPLLQLGWRQKRFKWYALYSWGCPFLISSITGKLGCLLQISPLTVTPSGHGRSVTVTRLSLSAEAVQ